MVAMVGRSTHAVLAFALAVIVAGLELPAVKAARGDDGGTDAIGLPRGTIQHVQRIERTPVTKQAQRAVQAAPPPPGFELVPPERTRVAVRTAHARAGDADAAPRTMRARGPPV